MTDGDTCTVAAKDRLSMTELTERFDWTQPLIPDQVLQERKRTLEELKLHSADIHHNAACWRYLVDYLAMIAPSPDDSLRRLNHALLSGRKSTKYFLSGPRGSGKSTRLNTLYIAPKIQDRYTVIGFSVNDYLNLDVASHDQLIGILIANVVQAIKAYQPEADLGLPEAKAAVSELKRMMRDSLPGIKLEQLDIDLFAIATAKFKESENIRGVFRKYMDRNPIVVLDMLDQLLQILRDVTGKEVLIVVDDLDKLADSEVRKDFFSTNLHVLLRPNCRAIFTYPFELDLDPSYATLKAQIHCYRMQNIRLYLDREYSEVEPKGKDLMVKFIELRLDGPVGQYIDPSLLVAILRYSCGNYRELARLVGLSFQMADISGIDRVDRACLSEALKILRREYNHFLPIYGPDLKNVTTGHHTNLDPQRLGALLQSLAVVEFPNNPGWLDVHAIVKDLLEGRPSEPIAE